jgi:TP901 family phage tail tape measure protein
MPLSYNLPRLSTVVAVNTAHVGRALAHTEMQFNRFAHRMSYFGVAASLAISVPIQIAIAASIKTFTDLEEQAVRTMSRIKGETNETARSLMDLSLNLSRSIPLAATDIQLATDEATRMGYSIEFATAATEQFSRQAVVMGGKPKEVVDDTLQIFKALGMETGNLARDMENLARVQDVLVLTQEATAFEAGEILDAFRVSATAAARFGLSIEEQAMFIKALQSSGAEASEAGSILRIALRQTEEALMDHESVWKSIIGSDVVGQWQQMSGLDKLQAFRAGIMRYKPEVREKVLASLGFEPRHREQVARLLQQLPAAVDFAPNLEETNVVNERFNKIMESVGKQLELVLNKFKIWGIIIGESVLPVLMVFLNAVFLVVDSFLGLYDWLTKLPLGFGTLIKFLGQAVIATTLLGAAAGGPLLLFLGWFSRLSFWFKGGRAQVLAYVSAIKMLIGAFRIGNLSGVIHLLNVLGFKFGTRGVFTFAELWKSVERGLATSSGLFPFLVIQVMNTHKWFAHLGHQIVLLGRKFIFLNKTQGTSIAIMATLTNGVKGLWAAMVTAPIGVWVALAAAVAGIVIVLNKMIDRTQDLRRQLLRMKQEEMGVPEGIIASDTGKEFVFEAFRPTFMQALPFREKRARFKALMKEGGFEYSMWEDITGENITSATEAANKALNNLRTQLQDQSLSLGSKYKILREAYIKNLITGPEDVTKGVEDQYTWLKEWVTKQGEGELDFPGGEEAGRGVSRFFTGQLFGTPEEYRARITGQQLLDQVTSGILNETRLSRINTDAIRQNTALTVEELQTNKSQPANLR